jgi:hypothetical protein
LAGIAVSFAGGAGGLVVGGALEVESPVGLVLPTGDVP